MLYIIAIIILGIYVACPIIGKIALLLANSVIPDPIPFVDEAIMWISLCMHLNRLCSVAEFISKHKVLSAIIGIISIVVIIMVFELIIT